MRGSRTNANNEFVFTISLTRSGRKEQRRAGWPVGWLFRKQ
jgi:hypothetical protein